MGWFWSRRKRSSDRLSEPPTRFHEECETPIVLSQNPTDAEIRAAVAQWIEFMACGDYPRAVASVFRKPYEPDDFRDLVETFGIKLGPARQKMIDMIRAQGEKACDPRPLPPEWSVRARVMPPPAALLDAMEIQRQNIPANAVAWIGFHLPLESGLGIWTTMGVITEGDHCVLEFEIFHM